jgi:hypothetical protein
VPKKFWLLFNAYVRVLFCKGGVCCKTRGKINNKLFWGTDLLFIIAAIAMIY